MLLNVHTSYSLLQSTLTIDAYIERSKQFGYSMIGIADINVLQGAVEFYRKCHAQQMQPLIGMTLKTKGIIRQDRDYSLLLYAKNLSGYQQLIALSKLLSNETVTSHQVWQFLQQTAQDIIAITTGHTSELEQALYHQNQADAVRILEMWQSIFGRENVYLGVSAYPYHPKEVERLTQFSEIMQVPLVMNQLVNTLEATNAFSLKVLEAIRDNETLDLSLREIQGMHFIYPLTELQAMYELAKIPQVVDNTHQLTQRLIFDLPLHQGFLPKFAAPNGLTSDEYLAQLIHQALEKRGLVNNVRYQERARYELEIIAQMGFSDYFLIVWEVMHFCKEANIRIGPGRGSAAGALISYLLEITFVDPLQYDLLFERFLNPERYNMPDIDVDIPDNKRDLVLQHLEQYYGHEQVAQIGTLGTFGAKQAIRDTLRVLNFPSEVMSQWSKAIPRELNIHLQRAYQISKPLQRIVNQSEQNKQIFQVALTLEGLPRHISTHAAGVVIHDAPLQDVIPVFERPQQLLLTQYTMYEVEHVGLLKLDILGLRNLSLLEDIVQNVEHLTGERLDVYEFPMDDPATLKLFQEGDTNGVFQFESDGIRQVLRKLEPSSFEDIVAVNALYRPGPMKQIDEFIRRKKKVTKSHLRNNL